MERRSLELTTNLVFLARRQSLTQNVYETGWRQSIAGSVNVTHVLPNTCQMMAVACLRAARAAGCFWSADGVLNIVPAPGSCTAGPAQLLKMITGRTLYRTCEYAHPHYQTRLQSRHAPCIRLIDSRAQLKTGTPTQPRLESQTHCGRTYTFPS